MKLKNAVVLVTGSNRGLGKALVEACLAAGAKRVYAGARDPKELVDLVRSGEGRVTPVQLDIENADSLAAAAELAQDLELLINNAGVLSSYSVLRSSPNDIGRDFAVNCFGTLAATKAFLPALELAGARASAALVNILSIVSLANMPALGGYCAAKAAAYSITQALRAELQGKNIRVHAVLPGAIDTDMVRAFEMVKASPESVARGVLAGIEQGLEEILPDPAAQKMFATWSRDPKQLERDLANMAG